MVRQRVPVLFETLTPFLFPCLYTKPFSSRAILWACSRKRKLRSPNCRSTSTISANNQGSNSSSNSFSTTPSEALESTSRLNPLPSDYSLHPFTDRCTITLQAGHGGNGCVSFVREKYIAEGPPNGGDGGNGGSIYVQAVRGETSLHNLARRPILKAGKGGNGQGKGQSGERGTDVLFTVPVGTVIKEVERFDPVAEERRQAKEMRKQHKEQYKERGGEMAKYQERDAEFGKDKWIRYPGEMKQYDLELGDKPAPRVRNRTNPLTAMQPEAPVRLDLEVPMGKPMLLAAGAVGGIGNPHFVTKDVWRPKYATKGEPGIRISLDLELKVLADVGLVGLPNAGKSTLLRALTNSRTRVGDWSFTTLQPSIGTVVLDDHAGRPAIQAFEKDGVPRVSFTIADIPGLIENAHLDRGLGLGFLRHIERASVLAFVVDLSAGDAVEAVKLLWREVTEFEIMQAKQLNFDTESRVVTPEPLDDAFRAWQPEHALAPPAPITSKPWFVVGTKADLRNTRDNFDGLKAYLALLKDGKLDHPSQKKNAWKSGVRAVPVSAIRAEGVDVLPRAIVDLL